MSVMRAEQTGMPCLRGNNAVPKGRFIDRGVWDMPNCALDQRQAWVEPEIRELDVRETSAAKGGGADVGGNPYPDCQRS